MPPAPHPADTILRFMALYSQVQQSMELTLSRYLSRTMPSVSEFLATRMQRLTDRDRIAAITALAREVGETDRWMRVPSVLDEAKRLRDAVGHSILSGSTEYPDGETRVYLLHGSESESYTHDELVRAWNRTWWALEQVTYIAARSGETSADGQPYRRRSGAPLSESPPPSRPPQAEDTSDRLALWEVLDGREESVLEVSDG